MLRKKLSPKLRKLVAERAAYRCEYCNGKIIWFLLFFLIGCETETHQIESLSNLRKLTDHELIERARLENFPDINSVQYINETGNHITRDSIEKIGYADLAFSDYVDSMGIVKVTMFRPIDEAYKELRKKMDEALREGPPISDVYVNCDNLGVFLDSIRMEDQKHRMKGKVDAATDQSNLEFVVNLLEKCGMPTSKEVSTDQIYTIWLVIQHSNLKYIKKYLPLLKEATSRGDLSIHDIATMEDRLFLMEGKAQIYGTQICFDNNLNEYSLCRPVKDELSINARRKEIGFEPIENYLNSFNK